MKFTNLAGLKTPGVYVREVSIFPPSIAQVPTAIPAFIGYTEKAEELNKDTLKEKPWRISSMKEYTQFFGGSPQIKVNAVEIDSNFRVISSDIKQDFILYDCLQLYFANGGGDCYIVSIGDFNATKAKADFNKGLEVLYEVDEPTMLVFPDAADMIDLYDIQINALKQCDEMMDRVTICDLKFFENKSQMAAMRDEFRNNIGMSSLKYGAAYAPWVKSKIPKNIKFRDIYGKVSRGGAAFDIENLTTETTFKNSIKEMKGLVEDFYSGSKNINKELKTFLESKTADYWAIDPPIAGFSKQPHKSLRDGFRSVADSLRSKIVNNDWANARDEVQKLFKYCYKVLKFINDFSKLNHTNHSQEIDKYFNDAIKGALKQIIDSNVIDNLVKLDITAIKGAPNTILGITAAKAIVEDFTTPAPSPVWISTPDFKAKLETLPAADATIFTHANANDDAKRKVNFEKVLELVSNYFNQIVIHIEGLDFFTKETERNLEATLLANLPNYKNIISYLNSPLTILPPSAAMAGVYARVDNDLGVWNAPANVSLNEVAGFTYNLTDKDQEDFNVDVNAGKSINILRAFTGMGPMVWGARTLAGNDNEWRYVPVRRFFNMVEESVMKSTKWAVFKPNDANLWIKVKGMIDNYLTLLWRQGALAGAKPDEAFFCRVGLNQTMTSQDILEGRLIVQIGMAVVRPAEFIILEFSHKLQTS